MQCGQRRLRWPRVPMEPRGNRIWAEAFSVGSARDCSLRPAMYHVPDAGPAFVLVSYVSFGFKTKPKEVQCTRWGTC